ncbi:MULTISPECIES: hypothetical protein [Pantoea]|jgi:hypothetical protein|uniref:Uncharacterized protein n=3 Tax=Pantoea TaxID=53335 RepID=A0A356RR93_ENTAG|nr:MULTISPECIES: hypothetical protein [Pantoea]AOE41451.1 hypothetical protein BEE12_17275 [Pantoea agglomerans]AYP23108.1 hypothetical protein D0A61_09175 [Pantoea agglomerans]AZI51187.1 hypothetical protein CBF16_10080 [Pantoea agglomerans]ERM06901.1 hypothetical protein L584_04055 [Pantoea agglomerans Tx10]EZI31854.1 hypothetical protein BW31_03833 [Pantoea agglomerans]
MKFAVIFEDTGVEEEHEFDTKPVAGDLVTLTRDGIGKDYIVIIEPDPDHTHDDGPDGHPTKARVRPA